MSRAGSLRAVAIVALLCCAIPARADDARFVSAKQVAGLFMQSCVQFAGNRSGLRDWARKTGLKELPANVQDQFLYGLPGVVFDASNKDGKFVLVSEDGGSCSTIAESANGPGVISNLEQDMNAAQISYKMTGEKSDLVEQNLQHREYQASQGDRQWLLLVSTVKDPEAGQVMLTANRY